MENRSALLIAIKKWQACKAASASDSDCKARKDAHMAYEIALYKAGVYHEALRGQRVLSEEVRANMEEPEHTFFHWAYCYATYKPETLKALHKAKSYSGRAEILDAVQSAVNKMALKNDEARKADCQRRVAVLIEESRVEKERINNMPRERNHGT